MDKAIFDDETFEVKSGEYIMLNPNTGKKPNT